MNSRTRAFAKQVQVDLLALSDDDLFYTIHHWIEDQQFVTYSSLLESCRLALGYTYITNEHFSDLSASPVEDISVVQKQWLAPTPHQLRILLSEMNLKVFIQYVIPIAFESLHTTYPEWGEGSTFNAHLANHLRLMWKNQ